MLHVLTAMLLATAQDMSPEAVANSVRVLPPNTCPTQGASGDIVVCGRRDPDRYRIPETLRREDSPARVEPSWDARFRDSSTVQRFEDQVSGPSAWLRGAQQRDCAYRAERQEIEGRPVDCTRGRPLR